MKNEAEFIDKMLDRSLLKEKKEILGELFTQDEELSVLEKLEDDIEHNFNF